MLSSCGSLHFSVICSVQSWLTSATPILWYISFPCIELTSLGLTQSWELYWAVRLGNAPVSHVLMSRQLPWKQSSWGWWKLSSIRAVAFRIFWIAVSFLTFCPFPDHCNILMLAQADESAGGEDVIFEQWYCFMVSWTAKTSSFKKTSSWSEQY